MRQVRYEYDIVSGLNKSKVLKKEVTRREARQTKREMDVKSPQVKHRIVQRRYVLSAEKEIR